MQLSIPKECVDNPEAMPKLVDFVMTPQEISILDVYAGIGGSVEGMSGGDLDSTPVLHVRAQLLSQVHNIKYGHSNHAELSFLLPEIDLLAALMHKGKNFDAAVQFLAFSAAHDHSFEEGVNEVERGLHIAQSFHWLTPALAHENFEAYNRYPGDLSLFIGREKPEGSDLPVSSRVYGWQPRPSDAGTVGRVVKGPSTEGLE
ncbi:MAG: hypothetical protein ABWX94_00015 [Candidatus Saccharimonadales bacterium]